MAGSSLQTRTITLNQSMTKPLLLLGCDRTLLMVSTMFCCYVGFNLGLARGKFGVLAMAIFLWFLLRFALMQMGKKDPLMLDVFRHAMLYTDRLLHTQYIIPAHGAVDRTVPKHMLKRWLK